MAEQQYERDKNGNRLDLTGGMITYLPPDLIPAFAYIQNCRRLLMGRARARPPLCDNLLAQTLSAPSTSLVRMNDASPSPPAPPVTPTGPGYSLIVGTTNPGTPKTGDLYIDTTPSNVPNPVEATTQLVTGLSGRPLSFVIFRPNTSPQPWCYVADQAMSVTLKNPAYPSAIYNNPIPGMVKVRSDGRTYKIGIAEPQDPPVITTGAGATSGPNWVIYRHRYRSSVTGAVSNPSPESPAQIMAQEKANGLTVQGVNLLGVAGSYGDYNTNYYEPDSGGVALRTVAGSSYVYPGAVTDWVKPHSFGLNIPGNANIDGVEVTMNWAGQVAGTGQVTGVALFHGGSQIGAAPKVPNTVNVAYVSGAPGGVGGEPVTYGSNTDLWGAALTPGLVSDSSFGFGVQITIPAGSSNTRSFLYTFTLTVYYTTPANGVYAIPSPDPQVDKIDFFRSSSSLSNFTFVGTVGNAVGTNPGPPYSSILTDTLSDLDISANPILEFDNFEPFPSIDLPRSGQVNVTTVNQMVSFVGVVDPGSGQPDGTYVIPAVNDPSDTTGAGASVQITISGGTIITPVTLQSGGSGYTKNPSFPVSLGGTPGTLAAGITPVLPITPNVTLAGPAGPGNDPFNFRWLPGTIILLGGSDPADASTAWTLYTRPTPSGLIAYASVIDPISGLPAFTFPPAGTNLTYEITEPALAAEPSPAIWGPTAPTAGSFYFGLDPLNPGDLLWSKGNNFDSAPDTNREYVTSPSEPLMNGAVTSEINMVFSTERSWLIYPNFADAIAAITGTEGQQWQIMQSGTTRGLYMRYAICALGAKVAFRAKDCIAMSMGGQEEQSITDSIHNLFPHGGDIPQPVTLCAVGGSGGYTVYPPDDTKPDAQTMCMTPILIYYNYQDTTGTPRTLVYDIEAKGWFVDIYTPLVNCHHWTTEVLQLLVGGQDGTVRRLTDDPNPPDGKLPTEKGTSVLITKAENGGDARAMKRVGDVFFKAEIVSGGEVTLQFWQTQFTKLLAGYQATTLGVQPSPYYTVDFISGLAQDVDDIGTVLTWPLGSTTTLDLWQPDWIMLPEVVQDRPSDWDDGGSPGNKYLQGMLLECDTFGQPKTFMVESDDGTFHTPVECPFTQNGQAVRSFTFNPPVTGHMFRIVSTDGVPWRFGPSGGWSMQLLSQPYPESSTTYTTEFSNFGLHGYIHCYQINLAYTASQPVTVTMNTDQGPVTQTFPPAGNGTMPGKILLKMPRNKWKIASFTITSGGKMNIWKDLSEVWLKEWGSTGPYTIINPFGGDTSPAAQI